MIRLLHVASAKPDRLTEELMATLSVETWFEFKPLFLLVHASLRRGKCAHGGEEMLRLRAYDNLQGLVRTGAVEKVGKRYRGRLEKLGALMEHVSAEHCQDLLDAVGSAQ